MVVAVKIMKILIHYKSKSKNGSIFSTNKILSVTMIPHY